MVQPSYFGGCNSADRNHSLIWEAVSTCRAFRVSRSLALDDGAGHFGRVAQTPGFRREPIFQWGRMFETTPVEHGAAPW